MDGTSSLLFSISRNVFDIRTTSYLQRMGIGVMFINTSHFTEALGYGGALDGLTITINTDGGTVLFDTGSELTAKRHYYTSSYELGYFGWTVQGNYDRAYIWSALRNNYISLGMVVFVAGMVFVGLMILLHKKGSHSLNYLFDNFSDIKKNQVYTPVPGTGDGEVDRVIDGFNTMFESVRTLNEEVLLRKTQSLAFELEKTEYALRSLYSQINKHFLINVLSLLRSFASLGEVDKLKACIEDLSDLLRYSLSKEDTKTVKEELGSIRSYLNIQKLWHPDIDFALKYNDDVGGLVIPKMILQPVIENSFVHGLGRKKGVINVAVRRCGDSLYLLVSDDGAGVEAGKLTAINEALRNGTEISSSSGNGLALSNVLKRLRLVSGRESTIRLISVAGKGAMTVIRIKARGTEDA